MQVIFDTFTIPSSVCIGDVAPIPKKGLSKIQVLAFRPIKVSTEICKLFKLLYVDELKEKFRQAPSSLVSRTKQDVLMQLVP